MMFQSSALFPWLSVAENLAFGLAKKNLDRRAHRSQIEAIARQLQLEDLLERKAAPFPAASGSGLRWDGRCLRKRRCC